MRTIQGTLTPWIGGAPPDGDDLLFRIRCDAFCLVLGDGKEIGRTGVSTLGDAGKTTHATASLSTAADQAIGRASWDGPGSEIQVPLSSESGSLPKITVEVWVTDDSEALPSNSAIKMTQQSGTCLVGTIDIGPDSLVSGAVGPLTMPLEPPSSTARRPLGANPRAKGSLMDTRNPQITLRITPHVGSRWGCRAMSAARAAKRVANHTQDNSASVLYMKNSEGSARAWRTSVTPGNSHPREAYDDVLELSCGSLPASCPRSPALAVAPISDIGVRLGGEWVGPHVTMRNAIIAFRPSRPLSAGKDNGDEYPRPPPEDEVFMRTAAAKMEGLLREVRARDMRTKQRTLALSRVREICEAWDRTRSGTPSVAPDDAKRRRENADARSEDKEDTESSSGREGDDDDQDDVTSSGRVYGDLFRKFLGALEVALPGVSVYIGLLQRGGQSIRYVACTRGSTMAGKELRRGEGLSFSCVGPRFLPSLIYPPRRGSRPSITKHGLFARQERPNGRYAIPSAHPQAEDVTLQGMSHSSAGHARARRETIDADADVTKKGSAAGEAVATAAASSTLQPAITAIVKQPERSLEEEIVIVQKVFRGKLGRDRLPRQQRGGVEQTGEKTKWAPEIKESTRPLSWPVPKVFGYNGRIGWPFLCVPLVGSLGASSIGVVGMDTFEQMGCCRNESEQPDIAVVATVADAAR